MRYNIRYPRNGRKTFAVIKQIENQDGSTKNETIKLPEIEAINQSFRQGVIDVLVAEKNIREIIKTLAKEPPVVHNNDNLDILEKYWKSEYRNRRLIDKSTAYGELLRTVRLLGNTSLLSASTNQIQDVIDRHNLAPQLQRRAVGKLNSILKFIKRYDVKLVMDKKPRPKVTTITEPELNRLTLPDDIMLLVRVLYYTGMRIGEAFAIDHSLVRNGYILVDRQIDRHGKERAPKWDSVRRVYVKEKHLPYIREWIDKRSTFQYKRTTACKRLRENAYKVLKKKVNFNTLRHSYATNLLSQGASFSDIAMCLGNSEKVCREYYIGYELTDEGIEALKRKLGA